jgi:hypothetical protein
MDGIFGSRRASSHYCSQGLELNSAMNVVSVPVEAQYFYQLWRFAQELAATHIQLYFY